MNLHSLLFYLLSNLGALSVLIYKCFFMIFDFYFINYFALEYFAYSRVFRSFAAFVAKPFYTNVFPYFDPLVPGVY